MHSPGLGLLPRNASGDGTGIAVAPDSMRAADFVRVVGRAWQASPRAGLKLINTAIGMESNSWVRFAAKHQQQMQAIAQENDSMQNKLMDLAQQNTSLRTELQTVQAQVTQLGDFRSSICATSLLEHSHHDDASNPKS